MTQVKHIIFDFGGVLLNIDYAATTKAFEALGVQNFEEHFSQLSQNNFFNDFETGKITAEDFINEMRGYCHANTGDQQIMDAWNAMLQDIPLQRLQILERLRYQFDIYLLSNTNIIHEQSFNRRLQLDHGVPHIGIFFDRFYFSHRVGMRKPNADIFQLVLNENNLAPENTLFIDDSPQHIEGAKSLGLQTIFLEKGKTIEADIFKPKGS